MLPVKEMLGAIPGFFGIRLEEEPNYRVKIAAGHYEVRSYDPMILATTTVEGSRDEAVDMGFNRLADYIFGKNRASDTMSMTTPVFQAPHDHSSETMSMTTPVIQEKGSGSSWDISFVLERHFSMLTAPQPEDSRIKLRELPKKTVAVYRYSGNNTEESRLEAETKLRDWIKKMDLRETTAAKWAQYDQPFALPFRKRNEVQIEVADPALHPMHH